jgi:hypothetical protein
MTYSPHLPDFLAGEPWISLGYKIPPACHHVSAMLSVAERKMLSWLTENIYTGEGEIVDLGAFIGGSAVCMADGLSKSRIKNKKKRIHSYDRFFGDYPMQWIKENTKFSPANQDSYFDVFEQQTKPFEDMITSHKVDLVGHPWELKKPIEILFLDVMKTPELATSIVEQFFPYMTPGRSILIAQDYLFHVQPYTVVTMEYFSDCFERAGDTGTGSVLFVNTKPIPSGFSWGSISRDEKLYLLNRAMAKQQKFLAKEMMAHLVSDMIAGKYP